MHDVPAGMLDSISKDYGTIHYHHVWEALGTCAENDYRFASYTAFDDQDGTLLDEHAEMRSKAKAMDCPYFDFCNGVFGACSLDHESSSCPAVPYE